MSFISYRERLETIVQGWGYSAHVVRKGTGIGASRMVIVFQHAEEVLLFKLAKTEEINNLAKEWDLIFVPTFEVAPLKMDDSNDIYFAQ